MGKPILVVFTGNTVPVVAERFGDFDAHFRHGIGDAWSGPWASVDAREEAALPSPSDFAGVIVTGSSSSVTERAPWMLRLEAWLKAATFADASILGVCFGHQILAQALGGEVRQNPRGRRIGTLEVETVETVGTVESVGGSRDPLLEGVPTRFAVNVSHRDHVALAPPGVTPLITAEHDALHGFAIRNARTVQFHPEFRGEIVKGYIEARREILRGEGLDPEALHAAATDAPNATRVLKNFVTHLIPK